MVRRAQERPRRVLDQRRGGAGHPRCQILVEVDVLGTKKCSRTVFWPPEVSDLR